MRKVSKKQAKRNRELAKIKKGLPEKCAIPYCYRKGIDLCHILPKSRYPEYYTEPKNLIRMCREHHTLFDYDKDFRRKQKHIFQQVADLDFREAVRHFDL